jgi:ABC-2 type transport system permease protein
LQGLPKPLQLVIHLNPLTYGVDGIRGALSNIFVFGLGTDFFVLGEPANYRKLSLL